MIAIRKSADRGKQNHGWLRTFHTFSFADYHDPDQMGFRSLRVINEDWIQGGKGFGEHPHRDMEILTYLIDGSLEHKDSMGNGSVIQAGEVQYMSAGSGVRHSEFNPSKEMNAHLLQIWILPNEEGAKPRYDQKKFSESDRTGRLCLLASGDGTEGSISIRQDARLYASILPAGETLDVPLESGRHGWLQVVKGTLTAGEAPLAAGDGAAVSDHRTLALRAGEQGTELLWFDLP